MSELSPPPNKDSAATLDLSKWFADEVQPHDAQLKAYLHRSFPAVRDVDDVVQESYLRAWRLRCGQPIRSVKAFLFFAARRLALNVVARQRRSPLVAVENLSGLGTPADDPDASWALEREEVLRLLARALATLPPRCREITVLRKLQGVPQREIAARLGIAEKTVEQHVARGVRCCELFLRRHHVHELPRR